MGSIAVSCRSCGSRRSVPEDQVCLGIRCQKCEMFMEAERTSNVDDLDPQWLGRRKHIPQLTPLAKTYLLLVILLSLMAAPLLYLSGDLEAAADSKAALRGVLVTVAIGLLNVVFAGGLLYLKKGAFFALTAIAVGGGALSIAVGMWPAAVGEVAVVGILFLALKAGHPDSWSQLR